MNQLSSPICIFKGNRHQVVNACWDQHCKFIGLFSIKFRQFKALWFCTLLTVFIYVLCYKILSFYQKTQQSLPMKLSTCGMVLMRAPFQRFNYLSLSLTKANQFPSSELHHVCYIVMTIILITWKIGCFLKWQSFLLQMTKYFNTLQWCLSLFKLMTC